MDRKIGIDAGAAGGGGGGCGGSSGAGCGSGADAVLMGCGRRGGIGNRQEKQCCSSSS